MENGVLGYLRIEVLCWLVVVGMVKRRLIMRSVTAFTPYRYLHIKNAVNLTAKNIRSETVLSRPIDAMDLNFERSVFPLFHFSKDQIKVFL